jgi:hypothetical protein
MTYRNNR